MFSLKRYIPINFTYIAVVAMIFMNLVKTQLMYYDPIRNVCIIIVGLYVISNIKFIKKEYMGIETVFLAIYLLWSVYSSFLNIGGVVTSNPFFSSIMNVVLVLTSYFLIVIVTAKEGSIRYLLDLVYKYLFIIMAINDLMILLGLTTNTYYLVGIKFDVAYLHILVLALFYIERLIYIKPERKEWVEFFTLFVESMFIIKKVDCATGLVGTVLLVFLIITQIKNNIIFSKTGLIVFASIACMLFPFWYNYILSNPYVVYFVEDILHKKISLTGRTYIYESALILMGNGWKIGYGIGTNYEICMRAGFVNIQNGFLKIIMESGIIGCIAILALICLSFNKTKSNRREIIVIAAYIFVFIILSSIEVTISRTFIFWILFLLVYAKDTKSNSNSF